MTLHTCQYLTSEVYHPTPADLETGDALINIALLLDGSVEPLDVVYGYDSNGDVVLLTENVNYAWENAQTLRINTVAGSHSTLTILIVFMFQEN
jgi:hypothetical protein